MSFKNLFFLLPIFFVACKSSEPVQSAGLASNGGTPNDSTAAISTIGYFDNIDADGLVSGWAYLPSNQLQNVAISLFVDGDKNSGQLLTTVIANQKRQDVNDSLKISGDHGFSFQLPDSLIDFSNHSLRVYAEGPSGLEELLASPRSFKIGATTPKGFLDTIDSNSFTASGWALSDRDLPGGIDVQFYIDGTSSSGTLIGQVATDQLRDDVNKAFNITGNHGFNFRIPDLYRDGQNHTLYAYGKRQNELVLLGNAPMTFTFANMNPGRKGIVRIADQRSITDDDGKFYPLGATLFWALRGWKYDRARIKLNLDFLKKHKWDYIRILGEVGWAGNDIDPSWPDYEQNLGELMDYAYNTCGLRLEITILGGGFENQAMSLAQKIAGVVKNGRQHMIMNFEVANESYQRNISLSDMRLVGQYLRQQFPQHLVALSSGEGLRSYKNTGNWLADFSDVYMRSGSANLATIHMDRTYGDFGWREVRQPWDWKGLPFPVSHNEPIGPRSSVAQEDNPIRLAMLRAVGILNGVPMFVLHNAAGVTGLADPGRNRPANLWEVPNIDAIMVAVRNITSFLPSGVGEGTHWNNSWVGNPWVVDSIWSDGFDHGVNRNYTVSLPDGWISTIAGVKDYAVFTVGRPSHVEIFDAITGKVLERDFQRGDKFTLTPVSKDENGMGAFIVRGFNR